jgi:adenylosuccinate synthase
MAVFTRDEVLDRWAQECGHLAALITLLDEDEARLFIRAQETVLFEGAQGVLLDAKFGFHPHTTWSDCTTTNAEKLLNHFAPEAEVVKIGVTRSHAVRHGPGPLPTESAEFRHQIDEHNQANPWQGEIRYGWFDAL